MRLKLLAILTLVVPAFCQTLPPGVQKKASVGGITEYEYPNGLRVLLYPDPANPKVTVNMIVQVGSRHEGYGETGMAHLLEHMDFIETNDGRQIKNEIVAHGAVWNGTTSEDRTNYYETVTATDENLKWALDLEAARLVNVKINKQLLDVEMTVVRNEFERGENSPARGAGRTRGVDGLPVAQLREIDDPRVARGSGGKCRPKAAGGILQEVLPAGQYGDRDRRQAG